MQRSAAVSGPSGEDEELNKRGRETGHNGRQPLQHGMV
jgi:hypothetical protein